MRRSEILNKFLNDFSEEKLKKFKEKFPDYYNIIAALYELLDRAEVEGDDIIECESLEDAVLIKFVNKKIPKALEDSHSNKRLYGTEKCPYKFKVIISGSVAQIAYKKHVKEDGE